MEKQSNYRHELKYTISLGDYFSIRQRIRTVMKPDSHVGEDGCYLIKSIYFDNPDDKALKEKKNGVQKREKFRIRYYNDDLSFISLEKKIKDNNLCMKLSASITEEECRKLLNGDRDWMAESEDALVKELYRKMNTEFLKPRVMVSYIREPYVYEAGNVRVTFDSDIRTSLYHSDFLGEDFMDIPVETTPGERILEVKYDAYLPSIIMDLVQSNEIRLGAYSKYGASRRFG